ncbi:reverse transcriptase domain-containing protein [Tanacetum coccineum]
MEHESPNRYDDETMDITDFEDSDHEDSDRPDLPTLFATNKFASVYKQVEENISIAEEKVEAPMKDVEMDEDQDIDHSGSHCKGMKFEVSCFDDLDFFKDLENEFPVTVHNDVLMSKSDFFTKPTLKPQHIDEFDLKDETLLSEYDEVEQNVRNNSKNHKNNGLKTEQLRTQNGESTKAAGKAIKVNLCACALDVLCPNNSNVTIPRRRRRQVFNIVEPEIRTIVAPMAERTMEELLHAPTERYGEAIVLPEINADHFEIKTNLLQLVQANPFYGRENDNPHAHINSFKRITLTLRFRNVHNEVIKLMMFPYSLEGAAKTWYEKEPPNSILTWEDLVTKFVNQFFPPSKTTHLKNEISRFTQKFEETFSEAWERFKELLRACPHHGFTELTQVDTFYNGLNDNEQDSLNAAAGGNLLSKTTREALNIIENKSKVRYSRNKPNASRMNVTSSKTDERIDKLADQLSTLVEIVSKKVVTPAPVKAVEYLGYCGGAHSCQINSLKEDIKNEIQNTIESNKPLDESTNNFPK